MMHKKRNIYIKTIILSVLFVCIIPNGTTQIGRRFPSERVEMIDPITGANLVFLTSKPAGDSKIYQTHNQWTSDGKWLIFRSKRVPNEAMAVNEETGVIMQVTEGGFNGMLNVARKSMKLFYMRRLTDQDIGAYAVIEVNLKKLFEDSENEKLLPESNYQRICGIIPASMEAKSDLALDASEEWAWFRVGKKEAVKYLDKDAEIQPNFGPRNMGAGPSGIAGINLINGKLEYVVSLPFQAGHIQSNPWKEGEIILCWETGGKSPQRTWIVNSDGSGLRPLYPEAPFEWVTHEAVIGKDEVAFAIMGHRPVQKENEDNLNKGTGVKGANPGQEKEWGNCGTREKPTGLGVVNIRTREMMIAGQIPFGSGFWHVTGSSDGKFVAGDDFDRNLYIINRETNEMMLLSTGHKKTANDHVHPTFSPDGTKIQIQSAMLSEDNKSLNICVVHLPEKWLGKD